MYEYQTQYIDMTGRDRAEFIHLRKSFEHDGWQYLWSDRAETGAFVVYRREKVVVE